MALVITLYDIQKYDFKCHGIPTNKNLKITNCLQENQIFRYYNSKNNLTLQQIDSYYKVLHYLQSLL